MFFPRFSHFQKFRQKLSVRKFSKIQSSPSPSPPSPSTQFPQPWHEIDPNVDQCQHQSQWDMQDYIPTSKEITPKWSSLLVIIVNFWKFPDGLLTFFFGQTKNKKPSGSTRDIFSQSAAKSKQTILPKTLFAKSKQLSSMGSVSKLVNHSLFLSTFSTHTRKTCHVPYSTFPKKPAKDPRIEGIETSFLPLKIGPFFSHHVSPWFFYPSGCCQ